MMVDWIEWMVLIVQDCHDHGDGQAYDGLGDRTHFVQMQDQKNLSMALIHAMSSYKEGPL